jgi:pyruvate dehydrogenase E2 component (dihydrolipoamide acetyltransferase)
MSQQAALETADDVMAAETVTLSRVRKAVAKAMTHSATVPQFSLDRTVQAGALFELRGGLPKSISSADLLNAAIVRALKEHPRLNASWRDDHIVEFEHINLGVAVAIPDGLLVPAINAAEQLSVTEMSNRRRELAEMAREGRLKPQHLSTATVSVSNLGTTGISGIRPMVIPPQAAIIGLPGPGADATVTVTVTCDHRVVDGLPAAQFLATLAAAIEDPGWLAENIE